MIDEKIKDIIMLALKYPVINRVGIFGSYARGEQTTDSDIDILFDYTMANNDDIEYVVDVMNYGGEMSRELKKLNIELDYVSYDGVINSPNNKIKNNILSEVVWVYER